MLDCAARGHDLHLALPGPGGFHRQEPVLKEAAASRGGRKSRISGCSSALFLSQCPWFSLQYRESTKDEIPDYSDSKEPVYACDAKSEMKIRLAKKGLASVAPETVMVSACARLSTYRLSVTHSLLLPSSRVQQVFKRAVEKHGDKLALAVRSIPSCWLPAAPSRSRWQN